MQITVLYLKKTKNGHNVAHVQAGHVFGDVLATDDIQEPGVYDLRVTLRSINGRLIPLIRVEAAK